MSPELCRKANEISDAWYKEQAAKPKPASVPTGSCYGCLKFNPPYCTMIGSIAPRDAGGCASKETPKDKPETAGEVEQWCSDCRNWINGKCLKGYTRASGLDICPYYDEKQTAGEGAIAIEPLRYDAGKSEIIKKQNELIDAMNRMREGGK